MRVCVEGYLMWFVWSAIAVTLSADLVSVVYLCDNLYVKKTVVDMCKFKIKPLILGLLNRIDNPVFQVTCRMYHAIFPCATRTNNTVAVSPATKVASYMVGFSYL